MYSEKMNYYNFMYSGTNEGKYWLQEAVVASSYTKEVKSTEIIFTPSTNVHTCVNHANK